ncbi:MAG: putative indolepyruvate oxidoreductase subunit [Tardiphaga sp.]|nr:putative indolepyruvate oxidoreductase subunit [Tardiphaga sp.]
MSVAIGDITASRRELSTDRPLSLAILAMGGQGGAVLADWIVALAEANGYFAQATSVPGVAQRTGATIYYVEMVPARDGVHPVLSLMPMPGDVDIVLAAEFMEAGRAILRGLVTPDRTTFIASTHRALAVVEKEKPGDGRANSGAVIDASDVSAKRIVAFDMEEIAQRCGTMISASMFGALAGADVLPFSQQAFEAVIGSGGRGAQQSLNAFRIALDTTRNDVATAVETTAAAPAILPANTGYPQLDSILQRLRDEFPEAAQAMLFAGSRRLLAYQDHRYVHDYLDRVGFFAAINRQRPGDTPELTIAAAKHIANAMAFDDVINVASLKTTSARFDRTRREQSVADDQLIYTTEFMHPRGEEMTGTLPRALGAVIERRPRLMQALDRLVNRGRRIQTGSITGFLLLYLLAGLRRFRRGTLRYARETAHLERWLAFARHCVAIDYAFAVEVLNCRRLVKGYSDTHARGQSKFDRVIAAAGLIVGRPGSVLWLQNLKTAALADEKGDALEGALRTLASAYDGVSGKR